MGYVGAVVLVLSLVVIALLLWCASLRSDIRRLRHLVRDMAADANLVRALPVVLFEVQVEGEDYRLRRCLGGGINRADYPELSMRGKLVSMFVDKTSAVWEGWRRARDGDPCYLIHESKRDTMLYSSTFLRLPNGNIGACTLKLGEKAGQHTFVLSKVKMNELGPR